jgi:PAS domain S-box-containing protein
VARLPEILGGLREVVFEADPDGRWTYLNHAWETLTEFRIQDTLGRPFVEYIHPDDIEDTLRRFEEVVAGGADYCIHEMRIRTASGGEHWVELRAAPQYDEDGVVVGHAGALIDVGETRALRAQLGQAQKLEAVGLLAGGIAHDMNNLLTVIVGFANLLLSRSMAPAARADAVEIRRAAERAAGLVGHLLAFTGQQVAEPRPLDLNRYVTELEGMIRRLVGGMAELELKLAPGLPAVEADPNQLLQVLTNLAVNARDAMPTRGTVRISTSPVELEAPLAGIRGKLGPGTYVALEVTDTGTGMDTETAARAFEPFFTTKEVGEGSGLGLSTVYGIVSQLGGELTLDSSPGAGTRVTILLPASGRPAETPPEPARRADRGGGETVLVAEDEEGVRALLEATLSAAGYRVLTAGDGEQALELALAAPEPIDLLVADVAMPKLDGPELAHRLRVERPGVRVLYLSGYPERAVVRHGVLGREPFLQKPFTPDALREKVTEVLARRPG